MILDNWKYRVVILIIFMICFVTFVMRVKRFYNYNVPLQDPDKKVMTRWNPYKYDINDYPSKISENIITETFVPWNSEHVGKHEVSITKLDQQEMIGFFNALINEDIEKIDITNIKSLRAQPHGREQARIYINYVLKRINKQSKRQYNILDIQTTYKETGINTNDNKIIDKWTCELFIQDKNAKQVNANGTNIRFVLYVQGKQYKITELHFITNHYYNKPLVDGMFPNEEYFRIKNKLALNQPFHTSNDKILLNDAKSDNVLINHHKELRQPQYRCFQEDGYDMNNNKHECDTSSGYWDKPVTNNNECPFYKSNKNYPNLHGGISAEDKQSCEMPLGTKRIGHRFISNDPIHKPLCYNCHDSGIGGGGPGGLGPCCEEQRNKELYPNLVSPDYAFPGDFDRGQYWKLLKQRGLHWQSHPTRIKDITNSNQKAPVFNAFIA